VSPLNYFLLVLWPFSHQILVTPLNVLDVCCIISGDSAACRRQREFRCRLECLQERIWKRG